MYQIKIWEFISDWTADIIQYQLSSHKDEQVEISISSPGGIVSSAMKIATSIALHGNCVVKLTGMNASCATWVGLTATKVLIEKNSLWFAHESQLSIDVYQSMNNKQIDELIKELENQKKSNEAVSLSIANRYAEASGGNVEDFLDLMSRETWINANQVVQLGLAADTYSETKSILKEVKETNLLHFNCIGMKMPEKETTKQRTNTIDRITNTFKNKTQMNFINKVLGGKGLAEKEDIVEITSSNLNILNKTIGDQEQTITNLREEKDNAQKQVDANLEFMNGLSEDIKNCKTLEEKQEKIKNFFTNTPVNQTTNPENKSSNNPANNTYAQDPVNYYRL